MEAGEIVGWILSVASATGLGGFFGRYLVGRQEQRRQHDLDRQLEAFKAELSAYAEGLRATHGRELTRFGLFIEKQHEAIRSLYGEMREGASMLRDFEIIRRRELTPQKTMHNSVEEAYTACLDAYVRWVLYLPESVDAAAVTVLERLGALEIEVLDLDQPGRTQAIGKAKRDISTAMSTLRQVSTRELARPVSADMSLIQPASPSAPAPPPSP